MRARLSVIQTIFQLDDGSIEKIAPLFSLDPAKSQRRVMIHRKNRIPKILYIYMARGDLGTTITEPYKTAKKEGANI